MAGGWSVLLLLLTGLRLASPETLTVLALLPLPQRPAETASGDGPAILPAAMLAAEHVNQRQDLLRGFQLRVAPGDSRCQSQESFTTYVSFVQHVLLNTRDPPVVGIVGLTCSQSAYAVGGLASRSELALVSIQSALSDQVHSTATDHYSFSITGSTARLGAESARLLQAVDWRRVAVLYSSDTVAHDLLQLRADFVASLPEENNSISIDISVAISASHIPFSLIKKEKTRILVLFLDEELARTVACLALNENITYPNYQMVWVAASLDIFNVTTEFWYNGKFLRCSANEIVSLAVNGSVLVSYRLAQSDPQSPSISGYSYHQFHQQYSQRLETSGLQPNSLAGLMYDSVWALALALNDSLLELDSYHYGMPHITRQISNTLLNTSFSGVSGQIDFGQQNRIIDTLVLMDGKGRLINLTNISKQLFISDSFENVHTNIAVSAIFTVLAVLLVELALISTTHLVTCCGRRERAIKAQSTQLNHFVYAGTYLFLVGSLLYLQIKRETLDETLAGYICHATWSWVLSIAFTLVVGTVTVRQWRVYRIFIHYHRPGPFISNAALVAMILLQLLVDLSIAVSWSLLDPIQATVTSEEIREHSGSVFVEVERSCLSTHTLLWAAILLTWKVLQLLSMFTLALLTRKVKNKDFSTQNIQVASYLLVIATVLGSTLYLFLFLRRSDNLSDFLVLCTVFVVIIGVCYFSILLPPVLRLAQTKYTSSRPSSSVRRMTSTVAPQIKKKVSTFLNLHGRGQRS